METVTIIAYSKLSTQHKIPTAPFAQTVATVFNPRMFVPSLNITPTQKNDTCNYILRNTGNIAYFGTCKVKKHAPT